MKQLIVCIAFAHRTSLSSSPLRAADEARRRRRPGRRRPAPPMYVQVRDLAWAISPSSSTPERAPLTVAQFLKYVDQGYYSGTIFHRAIPGFIIQGGGYDTDYKLKGTPPRSSTSRATA